MNNLELASPKALLVKMADRLHNLRTLSGTKSEKRQRIIKETREYYLPLFHRILSDYPIEGQYMLDEMEKAMSALDFK